MKCRECLIWRNKREDLAQQVITSVDFCCAKGLEGIVDRVAISMGQVFREHLSLMDEECPEGDCLLTG